jgi:ketosteroid isomerase-like protein
MLALLPWASSVALAQPAPMQESRDALAMLADRAQIEEMISQYYALFSSRSHSDFGAYYIADGILDANGVVRQGRAAINALYNEIGEPGNIDILVSNVRIAIEGDTAAVDLYWTECISATHSAVPHIVEQGREHDDLVKRDGRWYFKRREVTNDGGLPLALERVYKQRRVGRVAQATATSGCDRVCLESFARSYFEAMHDHDASSIAGSELTRYTENTVEMKLGQGLWATFEGLGTYGMYAADIESGQIVYMGTIRENGRPGILALRLKLAHGVLHEAEAIVHRQEQEATALEQFGKPEPIWTAPVKPGSKQATRDELFHTAGLYFEGLLAHDGKRVPFSSDCNRIVDGEQDTNNPRDRSFLFGGYNPAELSCTDNLTSPVWSYQHSIEPRRFAVADMERGLVFVMLMFNHPGNVTTADVPGVGKVPMPAIVLRPSTVAIADLFKIENGQIRRLEAVSAALPYLQPDPWSSPSQVAR